MPRIFRTPRMDSRAILCAAQETCAARNQGAEPSSRRNALCGASFRTPRRDVPSEFVRGATRRAQHANQSDAPPSSRCDATVPRIFSHAAQGFAGEFVRGALKRV
ncbi:hypothetical protein [Nocardia vinacea]|uniref:hypothetical protein n=1 Tax=Nocardia vinacea TaxID=96468 RepID=UPI0012F674DF|nr:hypothetical protein [Nocardia vinacea]